MPPISSAQKLVFNALSFETAQDKMLFHFLASEKENTTRIHIDQVPKKLLKRFSDKMSPGQQHLYTTFDIPIEGAETIEVSTGDGSFLLKRRYLLHKLKEYFKSKNLIVTTDLTRSLVVWVPFKNKHASKVFDRINLKITHQRLTKGWELRLFYDGKTEVYKKSVEQLLDTEVDIDLFKKVVYQREVYHYKRDLSQLSKVNYDEVYPILNRGLKKALGYEPKAPERTNRYLSHRAKMEEFINEHLRNEEIGKILSFKSFDFIKVPSIRISEVEKASNQLVFGKGTHISPLIGFTNHGPVERSTKIVKYFFISHEEDKDYAQKMHHIVQGRDGRIKRLREYMHIPYACDHSRHILFTNRENPIPEIHARLVDYCPDPDVTYMAIYISPFSKFEEDESQREVYYKVKQQLIQRGIQSQVICRDKILEKDTPNVYTVINMALAMLAKLGGTPWKLNAPLSNELVIGVGAFNDPRTKTRYIGSAFSFQNNGKFNRFEHFCEETSFLLASSIKEAIEDFAAHAGDPSRLIIHYFKRMRKEEMQEIDKALDSLELNGLPVYIVTINKTESKDLIAFDDNYKQGIPRSGVYIRTDARRFLLFNNTRHGHRDPKATDGYPFPLNLRISSNQQDIDSRVTKELINQVYQFSRMYWKSTRQQSQPITTSYPSMLAELAPHFDKGLVPEKGKDNLWFL